MTDTSGALSCSPLLSACAVAVDGAVQSRGVFRYNFGYSRQAFKHTLGGAHSTLQTKGLGLPRLEFVGKYLRFICMTVIMCLISLHY